jgi:hypothetical protein
MKVRLESGEAARALRIEGNVLTLESPRAFPPGAPIRFSLATEAGERTFEGRTIGSKRTGDDSFDVRLRFVNLRRADRERLLRRLG